MEIEMRSWKETLALTVMMSVATAAGTYFSSYFLIPVKMKEETEKAAVERKAKGMQRYCEKLQLSASLAAEIAFSSDEGYPSVSLEEALAAKAEGKALPKKISDKQLMDEKLALERRASELMPFLTEIEATMLERVTLHYHIVTRMRTSDIPMSQRVQTQRSDFNANDELREIRTGARKIAAAYRTKCTENQQ